MRLMQGTQSFGRILGLWIPAFAGMSGDWLNGDANLNSFRRKLQNKPAQIGVLGEVADVLINVGRIDRHLVA